MDSPFVHDPLSRSVPFCASFLPRWSALIHITRFIHNSEKMSFFREIFIRATKIGDESSFPKRTIKTFSSASTTTTTTTTTISGVAV